MSDDEGDFLVNKTRRKHDLFLDEEEYLCFIPRKKTSRRQENAEKTAQVSNDLESNNTEQESDESERSTEEESDYEIHETENKKNVTFFKREEVTENTQTTESDSESSESDNADEEMQDKIKKNTKTLGTVFKMVKTEHKGNSESEEEDSDDEKKAKASLYASLYDKEKAAKNTKGNKSISKEKFEEHSEEESNSGDEYSEPKEISYGDNKNDDENVTLDKEQIRVLNYVKRLLTDKNFRQGNPRIVIVDGPAGTGKTKVLQTIYDYVHYEIGRQAICTGSTGVVALNYEEGRTGHSMFGFPFNIFDETEDCNINDYNQQVSEASVIIYDGINLVDKRLIEILDKSLKKLMVTNSAFGGKIIIFGADFLELVPIVAGASDPSLFSVKLSSIFNRKNTKTFSLKNPKRTKTDSDFFDFLSRLGSGCLPKRSLLLSIGEEFVPLQDIKYTTKINEIIEFVYPDEVLNDSDLCASRVILAPTWKKANEINDKVTDIIAAETVVCPAIGIQGSSGQFLEYINQMDKFHEDKVIPDANLELWEGSLCMVIQTMYQTSTGFYKTLLNGAKVIVVAIEPDIILVRRPGSKNKIPIERKLFTFRKFGIEHTLRQFPLRLCYATTIHKSQGQTLDRVGVDLREPVFWHGQLYLALSRVRNRNDLKVCVTKNKVIKGVAYAANVVDRRLV